MKSTSQGKNYNLTYLILENKMRSKVVFWSILITIASVNMVAKATIYDVTYTSTIDLSYIGETDSANVSVSFRYDTNATPEKIRTDLGYARYWVDGEFTVENYKVEFTDALIIVANDRDFLGGDAFGVTNLDPGTTLTGQIFGYDIYGFAFELRDRDFSSIDNLEPPAGNDVLDNFDWNRNVILINGASTIETIEVPYTINAVIVPEPCSLILLGLGGLIFRRRKA